MALCCKVNDTVDLLILHQLVESFKVADIHLHELVVWLILNILQVGEITCVGELIEVNYVILWILIYKKTYYVATNKACTA